MMQSTIWVDSRTGSKELLSGLQKLGIPAELAILDCGDFAFSGNGPDGIVEVGVERKTISDLVGSLREGRLQGRASEDRKSQIDRMRDTYDVSFLLVEGSLAGDRSGTLFRRFGSKRTEVKGGYSPDSLTKAVLSLYLQGGMRLWQADSMRASIAFIAALFRWFTDKEWDQHATLNAVTLGHKTMVPLSAFREMVMRLPGIGVAVSAAVERHCLVDTPDGKHPSLTRLLAMTLSEWENLEELTTRGPRKFGTPKAARVLEAVRRLR
jgi:ERCC4-type nuclease